MEKDRFILVINQIIIRNLIFKHVRDSCRCSTLENGKKIKKENKAHKSWEIVIDSPNMMASYGYLKELKDFYSLFPIPAQYFTTNHVSKRKQKPYFENCLSIASVLNSAIQMNQLHIIKYYFDELHLKIEIVAARIIGEALKFNRVEIVKYLLGVFERRGGDIKLQSRILSNAPLSGNMELLQLVSSKIKDPQVSQPTIFDNASFVGRIDMIEWLLENRDESEWKLHCMYEYAIKGNQFHVIQHLLARNIPYIYTPFHSNFQLLNLAVKHNRLEILQFLHNHESLRISVHETILDDAYNSDLEILIWLHHNRSERCTSKLYENAAQNGRLDILKWLHENISNNSSNQDEKGFTEYTMDFAVESGNLDLVKWLHDNRTEGFTTLAMEFAATKGYLDILKFLHENRTEGCTIRAMDSANTLDVLKFLHENRTEGCSMLAMCHASLIGSLEIIKWLHENRTEGCHWEAIFYAGMCGHLEIAKWLHENRPQECYTNPKMPVELLTKLLDREHNRRELEMFEWCVNNLPTDSVLYFCSTLKPKHIESVFPRYWKVIERFKQNNKHLRKNKCTIT